MVFTLLMLCVAFLSTMGAADDRLSRVPFCDLTAAWQRYDGKEVATEALIRSSEHEVHVYHLNCKSTTMDDRSASLELPEGWNSARLGRKLSNLLRHDRVARVTFQAVFHASGGPYGPEGTRFRFSLVHLVSVEAMPESGKW